MSVLSLDWQGGLKFKGGPGGPPIDLDSSTPGVLSPMQVLAYAVMGCMAMDVAHVLEKGRHDLQALTVTFESERASEPPRRYTMIHLRFDVTTKASQEVVERAIQLSRTKYCSVSNSLRTDLDFRTSVVLTHP
jgi:putative redox protein